MKNDSRLIAKRASPSPDTIKWRSGFLRNLSMITPSEASEQWDVGLEIGNTKIGRQGTFFADVFVWNIPAVATCPGSSAWCLTHCYNADTRENTFPIDRWRANWASYLNKPSELKDHIISQLVEAAKPSAVRIHSSGDFFSTDYINFWADIADEAKDVAFWAYTRSWVVPELLASLENLRQRTNIQVFASHDPTMPAPPSGWRLSTVINMGDSESDNKSGLTGTSTLGCPEQYGTLPNCASCSYCITSHRGDVTFLLH